MIINIVGEDLHLFAERAVHWPRMNALIITDPHFGKAATFRHSGIPVPEHTTVADLERLTKLLRQTQAAKLLILGDLLHAKAGRKAAVIDEVSAWRQEHEGLEIHLLRGNHDRASGAPPEEWRIILHPHDHVIGPFCFMHEPPKVEPMLYTMCGHIHPCVSLSDGLHRSVRLPCFSFGERVAVLPSFGSFTGSYEISPAHDDRIFVIAENEVIEVSANRNG